jgi:hypothetical protein
MAAHKMQPVITNPLGHWRAPPHAHDDTAADPHTDRSIGRPEVPMIGKPALPALALAILMSGSLAHAQDTGTAAKPAVSRKCESLQRRVAKEDRSLTDASDSIAKDTHARESCTTKGACERYDQAIKSMEARRSRHETRLARFKTDADKACKV